MAKLPRIKIGTVEPSQMSNTEILKEYARLEKADSTLCDIIIGMGLGHVRPDEMYRDHMDKDAVKQTKLIRDRRWSLQWEAREGRGYYGIHQMKSGGYRRMGKVARYIEAH